MSGQQKLYDPAAYRLHNIVEMALQFSAMLRLFEKGSKLSFREAVIDQVAAISRLESESDFAQLHHAFCNWGVDNILLAERNRKGQVTKRGMKASYGQIAKVLDVALNVMVNDCHLPNCEKAQQISGWLNAAVDTKMMAMLRKCYPQDLKPWPRTIEDVDRDAYVAIQRTVRRFIEDKHRGAITPVQFDDIYWWVLNKGGAL
ncbi:MAG: hypothetical protein FJ020_06980 [Chloroflexi bacterium]|nr:hypothetical protein [Chloroflexota bacterium]